MEGERGRERQKARRKDEMTHGISRHGGWTAVRRAERGQRGRRRRRLPISVIDFHGIVQWGSRVRVDALTTTLHYADVHTLRWPPNLSPRLRSRLRSHSLSLSPPFLFVFIGPRRAPDRAKHENFSVCRRRVPVCSARATFIFFVADNRCTATVAAAREIRWEKYFAACAREQGK